MQEVGGHLAARLESPLEPSDHRMGVFGVDARVTLRGSNNVRSIFARCLGAVVVCDGHQVGTGSRGTRGRQPERLSIFKLEMEFGAGIVVSVLGGFGTWSLEWWREMDVRQAVSLEIVSCRGHATRCVVTYRGIVETTVLAVIVRPPLV